MAGEDKRRSRTLNVTATVKRQIAEIMGINVGDVYLDFTLAEGFGEEPGTPESAATGAIAAERVGDDPVSDPTTSSVPPTTALNDSMRPSDPVALAKRLIELGPGPYGYFVTREEVDSLCRALVSASAPSASEKHEAVAILRDIYRRGLIDGFAQTHDRVSKFLNAVDMGKQNV